MTGPSSKEEEEIFKRLGSGSYLRLNLDTIAHNVDLIRSKCAMRTGLIGIVSNGAYGLGSLVISRYLKELGVERLAVQTLREAVHLRRYGIRGPVHVLENAVPEFAPFYFNYDLIPTVCCTTFLTPWKALHEKRYRQYMDSIEMEIAAEESKEGTNANSRQGLMPVLEETWLPPKKIAIEVDTGTVRTGLDWQKLDPFMKECQEMEITVDSIFTQLVAGASTIEQLKHFQFVAGKFRTGSTYLHAADSRAVLDGQGTDLDFVRIGSALYGCTAIEDDHGDDSLGLEFLVHSYLKPAVSWVAVPRRAGDHDWTIGVGRDDGYHGSSLRLDDGTILTVTRSSKDTTSVTLPEDGQPRRLCHLMTSDFNRHTSCFAVAKLCGFKRPLDVISAVSVRIPRVYVEKEHLFFQTDHHVL